jgi:pimeloyl-ACP methyl ester carboxylesterase
MGEQVTKERSVPTRFDQRGNPYWESRMSLPDDSTGVCHVVPDRIIPVIFVPGVMGSNLRQRGADPKTAVRWRLDDLKSAGRWALPDRGAAFRKEYLRPEVMEVDPDGRVTDQTALPAEELRRRGWGEVGYLSYGEFLGWLENTLNDFDQCKSGLRSQIIGQALGALHGDEALTKDEVALSYRYRFCVHACGYNWLESNVASAKRLKQYIEDTVARYRSEKKRCEKVILVTHSMGGLVARYCSEVLDTRESILGVVHGVMPAIGAAAVYRRFKAGTENPSPWYSVKGAAVASALGNDAHEITAVLSSAPGPLQLLPTPEYGNGWLQIRDRDHVTYLPQHGDPYREIYAVRGKWWSLCEDHLMNPLNRESDTKKKKAAMDEDWSAYLDRIDGVEDFHKKIKQKYNDRSFVVFGSDAEHRAYGNVTWRGDGGPWLRRNRTADVLRARALDTGQVKKLRTVAAPLHGPGWLEAAQQNYVISEPEEIGDGTVPHRSGIAPQPFVQSIIKVNVAHESAFYAGIDVERVRHFTLRAILKISQHVKQTTLDYS